MMMRLAILATAGLLLAGGCGDSGDGTDGGGTTEPGDDTEVTETGDTPGDDTAGTDRTETGETTGGDTEDTGDTGDDLWSGPTETDAWTALYNYRGRTDFNKGQNELWMMDALGTNTQSVTELGELENLEPPLSCNYGCFVSPDLKWVAIVTGEPNLDGKRDFQLGQFNSQLQVQLIKDLVLEHKVDLKFAKDRLFYSEIAFDTGTTKQYAISVVDLVKFQTTKLMDYPSGDDLDQSNYQGRFRVSADGTRMVLLNTTIRSVTVDVWIEGTGQVQLDFLCELGTQGNCEGTGSEYSDVDPIAISPDGRWVVFFTFSDRWQRARIYDTTDPQVSVQPVLGSVPSGSYITHACDPGVLEAWQWQRVIGDPVFTPDGEEVLFLTTNACPVQGETACPIGEYCEPKKARTNLRRVKLETLLTGKVLAEEDVFNVTNNPFGDVTDNQFITGFQLSVDGASIFYTATPTFDQNGKYLADGSARQRNDREAYRIRLDGANMAQLTNDVSWSAESPKVVPLTAF